jgi:hypothetical protein
LVISPPGTPAKNPFAERVVVVPFAITDDTGIISIEVRGTIPDGPRVGVPLYPQPDTINIKIKPDRNRLRMHTLQDQRIDTI